MRRAAAQANRGRALEDLVERVLADVPDVKLFRIHVRWVPREGGKRGAFPAKGAPVDFVGVVSGVSVALECKEVSRGRRLSLRPERFPEEEVAALRGYERCGGRSFVVAAFWSEKVTAVIPFGCLDRLLARGAPSVALNEMEGCAAVIPVAEAARLAEVLRGFAVPAAGSRKSERRWLACSFCGSRCELAAACCVSVQGKDS